ncbi:MAG TPA: outer membrane beta-barrel protein [Gammaproteobacteria bacterium]|nr:outer membrane beta-barrel protein [Gammaproteobacteria bacterium]
MRKSLLLLLPALFLAAPAHAVIDTDFGVKAGMLSVDGDEGAATQAGIVYNIELLGMLGVEFEANTTLANGDAGFGAEYSATQLGAYGVLMTPGPIYFKAKAGFVRTDIEFDPDPLGASGSDTNMAYGIGIGFTALEIEYTRTEWMDQDVDMISASFKF